MPSVTSLSQFTLQNLGPLTTTFTAPSSCATLQPAVALARTQQPSVPYWLEDCDELDDTLEDCRPSGKAYFDLVDRDGDDATAPVKVIPYFSPGLICPESWTTAGVAVKDADGSVISTSGLYALPTSAPSPSPTSKAAESPSSGSDEYFKSKLASFDGTSYVAPPQGTETDGPASGSDDYYKDRLASFDGTSYVAPPLETQGPASGSDEYFQNLLASFDGTSYVAPPARRADATPPAGAAFGSDVNGPPAPRFNPIPNIMLEALGAGETIVACCPS